VIAEFFSSLASGIGSAVARLPVRNAILENPAMSLADPKTWEDILDGSSSEAGIRLNHRKALRLAPLWQGCSIISGDMACMQLDVHKNQPDGDSAVDTGHAAEPLVSTQWNEEVSAFDGWRRLILHAILWQNGFAFIDYTTGNPFRGEPCRLVNLLPDRTRPARHKNGDLFYVTEVDGQMVPLFKEEVLHVKGLSMDPGIGIDLLTMSRNAIGLALAAEGYGSRFFANGCSIGGVLEIPPHLTEKAAKNLEEGFRRKHTSKDNWFKTAILRDGAKFTATMLDAQKSQMGELREAQVREIARFLNLPPFKLGITDGSSQYKSPEQAQITYLTGCLNHWRMAVASECAMKLLTEPQRLGRTHFFRHNVHALIEMDAQTQATVLQIERQNEIISANEWRRAIGMPRRKDAEGDSYHNPNTKAAGPAAAPPASKPDEGKNPAKGKPNEKAQAAVRELFVQTVNRVARRVCADVRIAAKKSAKFLALVDGDTGDFHKAFDEAITPVIDVLDSLSDLPKQVLLPSALRVDFMDALLQKLRPLAESCTPEKLPSAADSACQQFEAGIAGWLAMMVFGGLDE
jgi:HK97 family phage portal protein